MRNEPSSVPPATSATSAWRRLSRALPPRLRDLGCALRNGWPTALADALAPRHCALCDMPLSRSRRGLCADCLRELPGSGAHRCPVCALSGATDTTPHCADCAMRTPAFDAAFALADYAPPLDRALIVAKFNGQWPLLRALGAALADAWLGDARAAAATSGGDETPILMPVPLSIERLTERGYNQAEILARAFAGASGWRLDTRSLRRIRHTARQSALHRAEREVNLRDAFRCRRRLDGRIVALVDDVMTTGATLDAAARALRAAGARQVRVFVVARTSAERQPAAGDPA